MESIDGEHIRKSQGGFRDGRSTRDQTFTVRQETEKAMIKPK